VATIPDRNADQPSELLSVRDLKTHLQTRRGTVKAVDGVSFSVRSGRSLGIVGETGSGKSMTAYSIMRLLPARTARIVSGAIRYTTAAGDVVDIAGLEPFGARMRRLRGREIALIFQDSLSALNPVHTIGFQIAENLRNNTALTRSDVKDRATELLAEVGMSAPQRRIKQFPHELSGGMRQRALIAIALAAQPRLLIADEPTTALDVTVEAQILELITGLQNRHGMGLILITHDMGVIAEMADQVVVMYLGRVVEEGPVETVFGESKHPYTQSLLRSIPSIHSTPKVQLPTITGTIPHPYNRPAGCPFHPRCPDVIPGVCDKHEPELHSVGDEHLVSCFLYHPVPDTIS
jgi:peptide/nickel transport system ATP-binding protein